jgi:hypothetical protein
MKYLFDLYKKVNKKALYKEMENINGVSRYIRIDNVILYYKDGKLHNEESPAVYSFEFCEWWVNGERLDFKGRTYEEMVVEIKTKKKIKEF